MSASCAPHSANQQSNLCLGNRPRLWCSPNHKKKKKTSWSLTSHFHIAVARTQNWAHCHDLLKLLKLLYVHIQLWTPVRCEMAVCFQWPRVCICLCPRSSIFPFAFERICHYYFPFLRKKYSGHGLCLVTCCWAADRLDREVHIDPRHCTPTHFVNTPDAKANPKGRIPNCYVTLHTWMWRILQNSTAVRKWNYANHHWHHFI